MSGNCPAPTETDLMKIVLAIRDLFAGRSNASGTCTCTVNVASTVVTAPNCAPTSQVILTPITANGAAELASGSCYVSAKGKGTFTLTHRNNATTGRSFSYAIVG